MAEEATREQGVGAYDFAGPARIVFGWGRRVELGSQAARLGRRALVVAGSRTLERLGKIDELRENLRTAGVELAEVALVTREPEVADVDAAVERGRTLLQGEADAFVLGIGGGAALDMAKAVAALVPQPRRASVVEYLEGVGSGLRLETPPLPAVLVPTTAGTGSEATKNAVVSSADPPFKKSLRDGRLFARVALVDPELTVPCPPAVTARSGLDALTQLIESYVSRRARPIPRALALQGIRDVFAALPVAYREPDCRWARERMSHAALLSGLALANSGLGMAHGVAAALGCICGTPHGLACAVMLPIAVRTNRETAGEAFAGIAGALGWRDGEGHPADYLLARVEALLRELEVPRRLSALGVDRGRLDELVRLSRGNSMDGNPRALTDAELRAVLEEAL